jgi:hypothetical protein
MRLIGGVPARQARSIETQEMAEAQLDLTSALRAGLGAGTAGSSFGIPADVNPFDYFADLQTGLDAGGAAAGSASELGMRRQDLPELQVAVDESADAHVAPDAGSASIGDLQVARMVQTMAAFGRSQGEVEWKNRDRDSPRFDYFA